MKTKKSVAIIDAFMNIKYCSVNTDAANSPVNI